MTRAVLLAAGRGARLRPLTNRTPKCLLPVAGRPLLDWWLDAFAAFGIQAVLVNTHYLAREVEQHVRGRAAPRVELRHEPVLLGSGGTIRANRGFFDDEPFFVAFADTIVETPLAGLAAAHREISAAATLAVFRAPEPEQCGIVTLDQRGIVWEFEEKPAAPASDLAFAGLLVASPAIIDDIPASVPCDLGADVFPRLTGRMAGHLVEGYVRDIGTPHSYARANLELAAREGLP